MRKPPKQPTGEFGEFLPDKEGKVRLHPIEDTRPPKHSKGMVNRTANGEVAVGAHGVFVVPASLGFTTNQEFEDYIMERLTQEWQNNRSVAWSGHPNFEIHQRVDGDYDVIFEVKS